MQLHPYQAQILHKLMYNPELRFTDLQIAGLTTKHFNYHLKELVKLDLILKYQKSYNLTEAGKDYVGTLDEVTLEVEKQPKISVALIVTRDINEKRKFLVTKRLKQPYYGKVGGFTGKIRFGELFEQAAKRELLEETGLTGKFAIAHIHHKLAHPPGDSTKYMQDNIFVIFHVTNTQGLLIERNTEQENFWIPEEDMWKRKDLFNTYPQIVKYALDKDQSFSEGIIEESNF